MQATTTHDHMSVRRAKRVIEIWIL